MARFRLRRLAVQMGVHPSEEVLERLQAYADRWRTASNLQVTIDSMVMGAYSLGVEVARNSESEERNP